MSRDSDWLSTFVRLTFLVIVIGAGIYVYRRYEVVHLEKADDSMEIVQRKQDQRDRIDGFPRGGLVLIDLSAPAIVRDEVVAYVLTDTDPSTAEEVRLGRVRGVPGDTILLGPSGVSVQGSPVMLGKVAVFRIPNKLAGQEVLFDEEYFVLNDNPESMLPDSRIHGVVRRAQIRGRVLRNWPW